MKKVLISVFVLVMLVAMIGCESGVIREETPDAPTNFRTIEEDGAVSLSWEDHQEDIVGYQIYRSTQEGDRGRSLTESPINAKEYIDDDDLEEGNTYYYSVRALRGDNLIEGKFSDQEEVTFGQDPSEVPPYAPINFSAVEEDASILLSWEDDQEYIVGYQVYRSTQEGEIGSALLESPINAKEYLDNNSLEEEETYYYSVRAFRGEEDDLVEGAVSDQIIITYGEDDKGELEIIIRIP